MTIDMDMPFAEFAEKHLKTGDNKCAHGVPNGNICDVCERGPLIPAWLVNYKNGAPYSQVSERDSGKLVAEVYQSLDNALLIAAAPAMYKALRLALEVMISQKTRIEEQADAITSVRRALFLADRIKLEMEG